MNPTYVDQAGFAAVMRNRLRPFKRTANSDFGCFRGQLHVHIRESQFLTPVVRCGCGVPCRLMSMTGPFAARASMLCPTSLLPRPMLYTQNTTSATINANATPMTMRRRAIHACCCFVDFALTIPDLCHNVPSLPTEAGVTSRREASRQRQIVIQRGNARVKLDTVLP